MSISGTVLVVALVALVLITAALLLGLAVIPGGSISDRTPLITTFVGLLAPVLTTLVVLLRLEATQQKVQDMRDKMDYIADGGTVKAVKTALNEYTVQNGPTTITDRTTQSSS